MSAAALARHATQTRLHQAVYVEAIAANFATGTCRLVTIYADGAGPFNSRGIYDGHKLVLEAAQQRGADVDETLDFKSKDGRAAGMVAENRDVSPKHVANLSRPIAVPC